MSRRIDRLVTVDQRPIGRTPRSNLATYTGMFDAVRRVFAATDEARRRGWTAGRFSFNVAEGRCPTCQGEGFVAVELLFLPGTYRRPARRVTAPGTPNETLEVRYRDRHDRRRVGDDGRRGGGVPGRPAGRGPQPRHAAGGRARLSAARATGHRIVRWGGPAHQAGIGIAADPPRAHGLRAG